MTDVTDVAALSVTDVTDVTDVAAAPSAAAPAVSAFAAAASATAATAEFAAGSAGEALDVALDGAAGAAGAAAGDEAFAGAVTAATPNVCWPGAAAAWASSAARRAEAADGWRAADDLRGRDAVDIASDSYQNAKCPKRPKRRNAKCPRGLGQNFIRSKSMYAEEVTIQLTIALRNAIIIETMIIERKDPEYGIEQKNKDKLHATRHIWYSGVMTELLTARDRRPVTVCVSEQYAGHSRWWQRYVLTKVVGLDAQVLKWEESGAGG